MVDCGADVAFQHHAHNRIPAIASLLDQRFQHDSRDPNSQACRTVLMTKLLLAGERKSVEPMAAKIEPKHVSMRHQSMHHLVANAPWDQKALIAGACEYALQQLERHGPVAAWVVDDTAFPKKASTP